MTLVWQKWMHVMWFVWYFLVFCRFFMCLYRLDGHRKWLQLFKICIRNLAPTYIIIPLLSQITKIKNWEDEFRKTDPIDNEKRLIRCHLNSWSSLFPLLLGTRLNFDGIIIFFPLTYFFTYFVDGFGNWTVLVYRDMVLSQTNWKQTVTFIKVVFML